jgi:hypothetical protein
LATWLPQIATLVVGDGEEDREVENAYRGNVDLVEPSWRKNELERE